MAEQSKNIAPPGAPYSVRAKGKHGFHAVRFTLPSGQRIERGTGERDPARALRAARHIYAQALAEPEPLAIVPAVAAAPGRARVRHEPLEIWAPRWLVLRKTLRKELSALRQFLLFCKENEAIDALPEWPEFAQSVNGVRSGTQRAKAISVSPEQVATFLRALPEFSPIGQFPVRARFIVAYETGLRPATLSALEVGRHYTRGATHLTITEDIDKARYARRVPLSLAAREALDRILPTAGPIFGDRKYRAAWKGSSNECGVAQWEDLGVTERHNWDASAYAVADALRYQHGHGGDSPIPEDEAIRRAHPVRSGDHRTYNEALRMVGAKRSKGALVELVNWALKGGRP